MTRYDWLFLVFCLNCIAGAFCSWKMFRTMIEVCTWRNRTLFDYIFLVILTIVSTIGAIFFGPLVLFFGWLEKKLVRLIPEFWAKEITGSIVFSVVFSILWMRKPDSGFKWWYAFVIVPIFMIGSQLAKKVRQTKKIPQEWKEPILLGWLLPLLSHVVIRHLDPNFQPHRWLFVGGWVIGSLLIWVLVRLYRVWKRPKQSPCKG